MIVDFFLHLVNIILQGVLSLVSSSPNVSIDGNMIDALAKIKNYALAFNNIFPVGHIFVALAIFMAVRHAIIIWGGVNWGLRRLPTQS